MNKKPIEETYHWDRLYTREIYYSNLYHDSIRGRRYLENLPLNVGNWAGNYCMMYLLNRLLHENDFKTIVELGLGESTKMILAYLSTVSDKQFINVEHDMSWQELFLHNYHGLIHNAKQTNQCSFNISPIVHKTITSTLLNPETIESNSYFGDDEVISPVVLRANLYIVDGPLGSKTFGRPDFIRIAEEMDVDHQFVAIFDDCNRDPELQSFEVVERTLIERRIEYVTRKDFVGLKTVFVLATKEKYGHIATM